MFLKCLSDALKMFEKEALLATDFFKPYLRFQNVFQKQVEIHVLNINNTWFG